MHETYGITIFYRLKFILDFHFDPAQYWFLNIS